MRVFLDANILFSASNPKWLTRRLLNALEQAGAALSSSAYAWDEAERSKHFGELMGREIAGVKVVSQRLMAEELARL